MRKGKIFVFLLVLVISLTSVTFADILKTGSKGAEVTKLQNKLKELGYFNAVPTGQFGSITKAAVRKFQADKGLTVDGVAGAKTLKVLYSTGTQSSVSKETLKKIQTVLNKMGLYKGRTDGIYGKLTKAAVKEFQSKYGLKVTGTIDKETETKILSQYTTTVASSRGGSTESGSQTTRIEAVNAEKAEVQLLSEDSAASIASGEENKSKTKIEVLDWWTEANKVFAIGSVAKVIDVRTGKSFYIKRTYGGNHADCETLTKEDTKIMKEIWGGFSWSRRPVIIEINGRRLAASMAGMPHAGLDSKPTNATVSNRSGGYGKGTNLDAVKNNGMDGHFDVHFKNSRTHGTNRVDKAHQDAIKEAAAAKI